MRECSYARSETEAESEQRTRLAAGSCAADPLASEIDASALELELRGVLGIGIPGKHGSRWTSVMLHEVVQHLRWAIHPIAVLILIPRLGVVCVFLLFVPTCKDLDDWERILIVAIGRVISCAINNTTTHYVHPWAKGLHNEVAHVPFVCMHAHSVCRVSSVTHAIMPWLRIPGS